MTTTALDERRLQFARELADPNFSLSVPEPAKAVIRDLLAALEPLGADETALRVDVATAEATRRYGVREARHGELVAFINGALWASRLPAAAAAEDASGGEDVTEQAADLILNRHHETNGPRAGADCDFSEDAALEAAEDLATAGLLARTAPPAPDSTTADQPPAMRPWTDAEAMELWWRTTGDDWPVPDDLPGRFLRAAQVTRPERALPDREALMAILPEPLPSMNVAEWPADERDFYRNGDWSDFTDRGEKLTRMRRLKTADAILDLIRNAGAA